jgi:phage shock protein A
MALKRKMGMAPPEAPKAAPQQVRVQAGAPAAPRVEEISKEEQDELAAALAELEAEEQREQARMKR